MTIGTGTVERLPLKDLMTDPRVQRALNRKRVRDIVADFRPEGLGVVTVSERDNDDLVLIDGMHRVEAAKQAGFGHLDIDARVLRDLTLAEEAVLFRLLNNTDKPQYLDLFRVRVVEGDPDAVALVEMADRHGWRIAFGTIEGGLAAIAALERAWKRSPGNAERTLATVTRAWGHDPAGVAATILEGLSMAYARYGQAMDTNDLVERLARYPGGPGTLVGRARGLRELVGCRMASATAELLVELYNRRRRTGSVPSWRSQ